jgi:hypothetical protein
MNPLELTEQHCEPARSTVQTVERAAGLTLFCDGLLLKKL